MASASTLELREDFAAFLERDLQKELVRFTTAGSVDDGKSTLIGRLLHDSKSVYEDQLDAVKKSRVNRSGRAIDFSLLTDGLRAEREQGITIDVAYRYFSTARRKFIIADTPGHEQYTRNMATGASTADLAVILVDATKGILPQTRRHAYIAALLGIPNLLAAINKMDLVDFREEVFAELERDFASLAESLGIASVRCIPISALDGDNVVKKSANTPWYEGETLLEHLENVPVHVASVLDEFRFPIQSVIRPDASFRGFAGRVASGVVRAGDAVVALPSFQQTRVQAIVSYDGELESAIPGRSIVLRLEDEIDLSRGDMLAAPAARPFVSSRFAAMLVWMQPQPLELNRTYALKHTGKQVKAKVTAIRFRVDINDLSEHPANRLEMNEIAYVEFEASSPLFFDVYRANRTTGSFIVIDPLSNATVGAGMIQEDLSPREAQASLPAQKEAAFKGRISLEERAARHGHLPATILVNEMLLAERVERSLFENGFAAFLLDGDAVPAASLPALLQALHSAGIVVVLAAAVSEDARTSASNAPEAAFFDVSERGLKEPAEIDRLISAFAETLRSGGWDHTKGI